MNADEVKALVAEGIDVEHLEVVGGGGKFELVVVSTVFEGLNPVKRQQAVYACLGEVIGDGRVHAVTMKTYTPDQWAARG